MSGVTPPTELLLAVFRQSLSAICITDADFRNGGPHIVAVNSSFCAMTGYTEEELIGQNPRLLQGPETDRAGLDALTRALRESRSYEGININYRKDGTAYHVEWNIIPLFSKSGIVTHYLSLQNNITARIEAERIRDMMALALNVAGDSVMVTDPEHRIVFVNHAFERLTGYTFKNIAGLRPAFLYENGRDDETYRAVRAALDRGESIRVQANLLTSDGVPLHASHSGVPVVDETGIARHYVSVLTDISELVERQNRLTELATTDKLTGLLNRHAGESHLTASFLEFEQTGSPCSAILCDVDHFKNINDTYGHPAGDRVLQMIAGVMQRNARGSDAVVRWGGEEFLLILPHAPETAAAGLAERLRVAISEQIDDEVGSITMSFGVTQSRPDETPDDMLARADEALYTSKKSGRNCVTVAPPPDPMA